MNGSNRVIHDDGTMRAIVGEKRPSEDEVIRRHHAEIRAARKRVMAKRAARRAQRRIEGGECTT